MAIELEADDRGLIIKTPWSPLFVSELKRLVPAGERQFDGASKAWIVDPRHADSIRKLILTVYHCAVSLPVVPKSNTMLAGVTIRVEYLGACKARPDGSVSATGHDGAGWNVIAPESVLRAFFGSDVEISVEGVSGSNFVKPATLYAVLVIGQNASFDEIKSAYKRMARLTHPDVNHEPDAAEQFKAIKQAWDVLGDVTMRHRYDAGLALEASLRRQTRPLDSFVMGLRRYADDSTFRAPLRCGLLTIDGERKLGRVHVTKIHKWEDIVNDKGQVMVSSWNSNRQEYEIQWA